MKFSIAKQRLNNQGYTSEGYYFGVGEQLWVYSHCAYNDKTNEWTNIVDYLRAPNRNKAIAELKKLYPNAICKVL